MTRLGLLGLMCLSGAAFAAPRDGWRFRVTDFVIAAWSPPDATDAEYEVYQQAGFNLVMTPRYALPDEALRLAQKHGLGVMIDTYTPNDKPWGGTADEYTPHPSHHPATLSELRWLHDRYGDHPALAGYLLGDDYGVLPPELVATTRFLREQAPHLIPWICQNVMSARSLAGAGNPIQNPQIYPTLYQRDWPAAEQAREFCRQLEQLRAGCEEYGLIPWPMFNVSGVDSDSLLRFQIHASLAYGAQGLWYFTYRDHGGVQTGGGYASVEQVRAHLRPLWDVAAEENLRVAQWGPDLLGRSCAGVFYGGARTAGGTRVAPDRLVRSMDDDLLVGVLVGEGEAPLAMVVDRRVSMQAAALAPRQVTVSFAAGVTSIEAVSEDGAWEGSQAQLTLPAGGGQLLRLRGEGLAELCAGLRELDQPAASGPPGEGGLVLSLSFDEGQGETARDESGLRNDLQLSGATWAEGARGSGVSLDAPGACVMGWDLALPLAREITVAAWVRPGYPDSGYGPVVYLGSGSGGMDRCEFGFGPDNLYPVITDKETHSGAGLYVNNMRALIPPGQWGHVAIVAGPDGAATYVNGREVARTVYAGRFDFDEKAVRLGMRGHERYSGAVDELQVWARRLSAQEITNLAARAGQ